MRGDDEVLVVAVDASTEHVEVEVQRTNYRDGSDGARLGRAKRAVADCLVDGDAVLVAASDADIAVVADPSN